MTNETLERAALIWVLWHHQGGSSTIGHPIRLMLGIGEQEHLTDDQVSTAKDFALRLLAEQPRANFVLTRNQDNQAVALTRQDDEGRIVEVLWERPAGEPVGRVNGYGIFWLKPLLHHGTLLYAAPAAEQPKVDPVAWVRMRDGEIDWSEDCLSMHEEDVPSEEGYAMLPLYAAPVAAPSVGTIGHVSHGKDAALAVATIAAPAAPSLCDKIIAETIPYFGESVGVSEQPEGATDWRIRDLTKRLDESIRREQELESALSAANAKLSDPAFVRVPRSLLSKWVYELAHATTITDTKLVFEIGSMLAAQKEEE